MKKIEKIPIKEPRTYLTDPFAQHLYSVVDKINELVEAINELRNTKKANDI